MGTTETLPGLVNQQDIVWSSWTEMRRRSRSLCMAWSEWAGRAPDQTDSGNQTSTKTVRRAMRSDRMGPADRMHDHANSDYFFDF